MKYLLLMGLMVFFLLVSLTPLLGYTDKKWVLPFMWGLFGLFTLIGWLLFIFIGAFNF
jgi:hypothetical protein